MTFAASAGQTNHKSCNPEVSLVEQTELTKSSKTGHFQGTKNREYVSP